LRANRSPLLNREARGEAYLPPEAIHEAAHAVAAFCFRRKITSVRINGDGTGLVRCEAFKLSDAIPEQQRTRGAWEETLICLAGPIAERRFVGDETRIDLKMACEWLKALGADRSLKRLAIRETDRLLRENWEAVAAVGRRLMRARFMSGAEVERVCRLLIPERVSSAKISHMLHSD
jgi:hypothetical protein